MEEVAAKIHKLEIGAIVREDNGKTLSAASKASILAFIGLLIAALPSLAQTKYVKYGVEYTLYVHDAIEYTLNDDGTAIVSKHTDKLPQNVIIPSKITISNKEYTVTNIDEYAFSYCETITSVTIPGSITTIGNDAFNNCTSLLSVTIPGNVSKIGNNAFKDCTKLTMVTLNEGLVEIGWNAFANCKNLITLSVPKSVMRIGSHAFEGIANVNYKGYASGKPWDAKTINGTIEGDFIYSDAEKTILTAYIGKDSDIIIPNGVISIGRNAFYECDSLLSVHLPLGLKTIDWCAFRYCSNLKSINIPEGVTDINYGAFQGCKGLISLTIPTSVKKIGDKAFDDIPNVNFPGPQSLIMFKGAKTINGTIDGDFVYEDTGKKQLSAYIGDDINIVIPQGVVAIGKNIFSGNQNIKSVEIPESVTSIDYLAFANCYGIKTLNIPESVTSIGKGAFMRVANVNYGGRAAGSPWNARTRNGIIKGDFVFDDAEKTQLTAYIGEDTIATIPQGVKKIHIEAFVGCENLKKVIIPKTVTTIGEDAFLGCKNVTDVYCYANPMYLSWDGDGFMQYGATKFHVPATLLAKYESEFGEDANVEFIGDL